MLKKIILVSGGAGYIGSCLVGQLLRRGYIVKVIDNLSVSLDFFLESHPRLEFFKGDIRNDRDLRTCLKNVHSVIHLAAIVGDPACAKNPEAARETNLKASQNFYQLANELGVERFLFASTCSNYGKMENPNAYVDEASPLKPVSLYAETKVAMEKFLLQQDVGNICRPTCLRFSTVYGLSPRPRFDVTINEFTRELALGRELSVYGENFWRPYVHVVDVCRAVILALESPLEKVAFEVFNVGDTAENYQKKMILEEIQKQLGEVKVKVKYLDKKVDPRDYRVSFAKIQKELGFKSTKTVPQGIREMIKVIRETEGFFS